MESTRLSGSDPVDPDPEQTPAVPRYTGAGLTGDGNVDYIISDYMERLGERLNILETELKYAWSALDLLSQEYIKMWERLEKLEGLLYEQQTVISQLIEFYTSGTSAETGGAVEGPLINSERSSVGELDAIAKSLGPAMGIEDTSVLREKLAQQELARMHVRSVETLETLEEEEGNIPDEAFYRSLNNAYREDLICGETSRPTSQLGMIWEEAEDVEESNGKKDMDVSGLLKEKDSQNEVLESKHEKVDTDADEEGEIFSAADYKSYRGNTPCVSEQDLAQLSKLSSLDQVALEKLHELDKLTSKLQKDSQELIELNTRLTDSPKRQYASEVEAKLAEETSSIDEQLRKIYAETDVDNWTYSKSPGSTGRSISRVSTDSGLATDGDFTARSISPRLNSATPKSHLDSVTSTYNPPRLSYTTSLLEKSPEPVMPLPIDPGNFAKGYAENKELTDLMAESFVAVTCASPTIFSNTTDKLPSPTLSAGSVHSLHSVQSLRTRQDGYFGSAARLNFEFPESRTPPSPSPSSPPPPAPRDSSDAFLMLSGAEQRETEVKCTQSPNFLRGTEKLSALEQDRLSPRTPHSPKSPRVSPKHAVKPSNAIVAAKSDSGLSSMSGWSSLDKSPVSPKPSLAKMLTSYSMDHSRSSLMTASQPMRPVSPIPPLPEAPATSSAKSAIIQEPLYDTPEGRDAFGNISASVTSHAYSTTTINHVPTHSLVKSPATKEEYPFVPPPAPSSAACQSPKKRHRAQSLQHTYDTVPPGTMDSIYRPEQPAIYSVAGSNRQHVITGVYTNSCEAETGHSYGFRVTGSDQFYGEPSDQYVNYPEGYNSTQYTDVSLQSYAHSRKPTRAMSYGEGMANYEGYKMYRSMFPTGNITDALSYYPTSANLPRTEHSDSSWLNVTESRIPHDSTSSSIRSLTSDGSYTQSPYADRRYPQPPAYQGNAYHRTGPGQTYPHGYQQQYQPYNQRVLSSEGAQLPDGYQRQRQRDHQYAQEQESSRPASAQSQNQQGIYYDASNVIVSQSGYISISADIKDHEDVKMPKKVRRGTSLKNAMSSMSHWLPDLHLTKRHRSQSLPGGVRREDLDSSEQASQPGQVPAEIAAPGRARGRSQAVRKKKKNTLVSTVSGILQKAKRRSHHSQSLSDPEQSETEWSSGRQSGLSEDEDSILSDLNQDPPFFAKVRASHKRKGPPPPPMVPAQQQQLSPQQAQTPTAQQQQQQLLQQQQQQAALQQQIQQHQEQLQQLQQQVAQESWKERDLRSKHENSEHELSDNLAGPDETHDGSGKSTGSGSGGSTSMFPTVGDIKKSTGSSDEAPNEKAPKLPVTLMGGASMEFAVSRALGKYRQRQSSTVSDDQTTIDDTSDRRSEDDQPLQQNSIEEIIENNSELESIEKNEKTPSAKPPELVTSLSEEAPVSEGSPSASSTRGVGYMSNRFLPRHQQSLEIPWAGSRSGEGDEDNRSTHSYRSTSRVSSRRQSTEDSIDSEDEWYCYELRKLEELERQGQMESEMGEVLVEEPETTEPFQPGEEIKERMSFVLKELKLKSIPRGDDDKKEVKKTPNGGIPLTKESRRIEDDGKPIPKKKTADTIETVFARVTDYHTWAHEVEARREERIALLPMDEGSSGETSGPDSPVHSMDELEEELDLRKDLEEQSQRSSSGSTKRRSETERHLQGSDSLSREGSVSVPPSEVSVSIPGAWDSESTVPDGERDGAGSETETATLSLPKIKIDSSSCGSSDTTLIEGQVSPGPPGSKWKLLKALKERKAEDKLKEEEDATAKENAVLTPPASVSIMIK